MDCYLSTILEIPHEEGESPAYDPSSPYQDGTPEFQNHGKQNSDGGPSTTANPNLYFGEDSKEQTNRIRKLSPFGDLKSWRLLHMIVKTGADMKEEQFALQLISQFNQIFRAAKLKLIVTPYEIMSLGILDYTQSCSL